MKEFVEKHKKLSIILSVFVLCILIILVYINFAYNKPVTKFRNNTYINNINVSGLTSKEASDKIIEIWNNKEFLFIFESKTCKLPLKNLSYNIEKSVSEKMNNPTFSEKMRYFLGTKNNYQIQMTPESNDEFLKQVSTLPMCDNTRREKTQNAYIDLSNFDFNIVEEKIGTEIDPQRVSEIALTKISENKFRAELELDDIVKLPTITKTSKEIIEEQNYYKKNLNYEISYGLKDTSILTPKELDDMVKYTEDSPKYNDDAIYTFVENLARSYDEYNANYSFETSYGSNITVHAANFGRLLSVDDTVENLKNLLKSQKSKKLKLAWAQTKYQDVEGIGNSYIEISISNQHLWCYKNGNVIAESNCVTGSPGHDTSCGVFTKNEKESPDLNRLILKFSVGRG